MRAPGLRRRVGALFVVFGASAYLLGIGVLACGSFEAGPEAAPPDGGKGDSFPPVEPEGRAISAFCRSIDDAGLVFCDSFDTSGLAEWAQADSDPSTRYAVETTSYASPPGAARCSIVKGNASSQDARLRRKMPGAYSKVEISGVTRRTEGGNEVLQFSVVDVSGVLLFLRMNGEVKWRVAGADASSSTALLARADASLRADFIEFSIMIDSTTKDVLWRFGDQSASATLPALQDRGEVTLNLGPAESNTTAGWTVLYDNIVVRGTAAP